MGLAEYPAEVRFPWTRFAIGRILCKTTLKACLDYYKTLGDEFYEQLCSMLVFDALIYNEDRHFGNFGLLRNNHTGEIIAPAPIFDNGLSLFNYAMPDDFKNLSAYARPVPIPTAFPMRMYVKR